MESINSREFTVILIKPDAVKRGLIGEIVSRFEKAGLKIKALKMIQASKEKIKQHYSNSEEWLKGMGNKTLKNYSDYGINAVKELGTDDPLEIGKMIRNWNIEYLTSGPLVVLVLEGIHAIAKVRKLIGNTLPIYAEPGTIRGDFSSASAIQANAAHSAIKNLIHASGNLKESKHELNQWFSSDEIFDYKLIDEDLF